MQRGGTVQSTYAQRQAVRRQLLPNIELSILFSDPLQSFQTERLVRAGCAHNLLQRGSGDDAQPPPYFPHCSDEWRRVQAVVPLMDNLAQRFGQQLHRGIRDSGQRMVDIAVPHRAGILVVPFSLLLGDGFRRYWGTRLQEAQPPASGPGSAFVVCCLVLMDCEEPQLDVLSWVNLVCMEVRVALQMVWSWGEACAVVEGFAEAHADVGMGGGGNYSTGQQQLDRMASLGPIPILAQALSQTPALMTRQDVVRAGNRVETVADLLLIQEDTLLTLPGIGAKKAKRIMGVMGAAFPTTAGRLHQVWVPPEPPLLLDNPPQHERVAGDADTAHPAPGAVGDGIPTNARTGPTLAAGGGAGGNRGALQRRAGGGLWQQATSRSDAFNAALHELLAREDALDDE